MVRVGDSFSAVKSHAEVFHAQMSDNQMKKSAANSRQRLDLVFIIKPLTTTRLLDWQPELCGDL